MITSIRLKDFKNFADETLKLGPFTVIVGANASGKSNIRDAFRFLHGIGRGYTLAEIIGGKIGVGGQQEWAPIRGAMNEIVRFRSGSRSNYETFEIVVHAEIDQTPYEYGVRVRRNVSDSRGFLVNRETFMADGDQVYSMPAARAVNTSHGSRRGTGRVKRRVSRTPYRYQPVLTQNRPSKRPDAVNHLRDAFGWMRFYDFDPVRMREPSFPGATVLGDGGENLPTVLEAICSDEQRRRDLYSWLDELTPMEVRGLEFPLDPSGRIHLYILDGKDRRISAYSASDGTLRFLALLAAVFSSDEPRLCFLEEIDAGIHPARMWLIVEFIESQTSDNGLQVVTTTHSPALLEVLNENSFADTSVVYRDEESEDSVIRALKDLSIAAELRESQGLAKLHSVGWMENVLSLEHDPEEEAAPVT